MGKTGSKVYHLKIVLDGVEPPVWRRVLVSADTGLDRLHRIVQIVMGWENCHMHQFHIGKDRVDRVREEALFSEPDPEMETKDENHVTIAEVLPRVTSKIVYEYDFSDSWMHTITVEKIEDMTPVIACPACLDGQRACPPEDCGDIEGYYQMLDILADPRHPEHRETRDWLGDEFDPEEFDVGRVNWTLKKLAGARRGWVKADGMS